MRLLKQNARETSKAINQQPLKQKYDNKQNPVIVGAKNKIGDPDITQLHAGVTYPNTGSALNFINSALIPVNGVLLTYQNTDPSGVPCTERLTVTLPYDSITNHGTISIYGTRIDVEPGEVLSTITQKISDRLSELIEDSIGIDSIYRPNGTNNILDVTYIDRNYHEPVNLEDNDLGVHIKGEIIVDPLSGYGTWEKVGNNTTLVDGVQLQVWRRIA